MLVLVVKHKSLQSGIRDLTVAIYTLNSVRRSGVACGTVNDGPHRWRRPTFTAAGIVCFVAMWEERSSNYCAKYCTNWKPPWEALRREKKTIDVYLSIFVLKSLPVNSAETIPL